MSASPDIVRNGILRGLPADELIPLLSRLEHAELTFGTDVLSRGATIDSVHFIETGVVSIISAMDDGTHAEVGLIGREGLCGLQVALGVDTSTYQGLVQVGGSSRKMSRDAFTSAFEEMPTLRKRVLEYIDAFMLQVSQTAACNARHVIEQRLARWILMTADRVETDQIPMTQQFLSAMLGVQRPGVTLGMQTLHRAGFLELHRGRVRVANREGLTAAACECYAVVKERFALLNRHEVAAAPGPNHMEPGQGSERSGGPRIGRRPDGQSA